MTVRPGVHAIAALADHDGPVLADTHIWVWFMAGDETRLRSTARRGLERVRMSHGVLISDASAWELAIKVHAGRVRLSGSPAEFVERSRRVPGFEFQPLHLAALLSGAALIDAPADPFDRALIATARANGIPLVTADRRIIMYARATRAIAVYAVR